MSGTWKLLIVDDERWELEFLRSLLIEKYGALFIIQVAANGKQAVDVAKENDFDLVLMDINMPLLNGLQAIEQIKQSRAGTEFIVLTAYGEFEYAQQALHLGAFGYLLKPVDPQQLFKKIDELTALIDERKRNETEKDILRSKMKQITPYMRNLFLEQLLFDQFENQHEMEEYRNICGVQELPQKVAVGMLTSESKSEPLLNYLNANGREEVRKSDYILFDDKLILFTDQPDILTDLLALDPNLLFGIGLSYSSFKDIHLSYKEAVQALGYANLSQQPIMCYEDIPHIQQNQSESWVGCKKRLYDAIRKMQKKEALQEVNNLVQIGQSFSKNIFKMNAMEILYSLSELMVDLDFDEKMINEYKIHYMTQIGHMKTFVDLSFPLKKLVVNMIEAVTNRPKNSKEELIKHCKAYIKKHYKEEINLSNLSDYFHVSPTYLSKLFKKVEGINIVNYINEIRMEQAKTLLVHSVLTIEEISDQIGYKTQNYFSFIFKKIVGYTPTEYRVKLRQ
jgi:two-component system response regulator YesN